MRLLLIFFYLLLFAPACAANDIQELMNKHKQAVVKITVIGQDPDGQPKHIEGSGFIVYSDSSSTYIITAAHVLKSSQTKQSDNRDWKIDGGKFYREIRIESYNGEGSSLVILSESAAVASTSSGEADLALLQIKGGPYPTLGYIPTVSASSGQRSVVLLGFRAGQRNLTSPATVAEGSINNLKFRTDKPSYYGESGGPWIDRETGCVIAIASGIDTSPSVPTYEGNLIAVLAVDRYFKTQEDKCSGIQTPGSIGIGAFEPTNKQDAELTRHADLIRGSFLNYYTQRQIAISDGVADLTVFGSVGRAHNANEIAVSIGVKRGTEVLAYEMMETELSFLSRAYELLPESFLKSAKLSLRLSKRERERNDSSFKSTLLFEEGLRLLRDDRASEALELLEEATKVDPKNLDAYWCLSYIYSKIGNVDKADYYNRIMKSINPDYPIDIISEGNPLPALRSVLQNETWTLIESGASIKRVDLSTRNILLIAIKLSIDKFKLAIHSSPDEHGISAKELL